MSPWGQAVSKRLVTETSVLLKVAFARDKAVYVGEVAATVAEVRRKLPLVDCGRF